MGTLISTPGTRFPRAVREPPRRLGPVGSPLDSLFPQESRTFRSNQLRLKNSDKKIKGVRNVLILNHDFKTRLHYSLCFFTVILIGWKKFATLLPNYWLAKTPQPLGEEAWQAVGGKGADF
ncbi:hypothetical protein SOP94_14445 [Peribacillus frigoritolerans]|uniref:hypothetical protein n=1 Tax=Peribacillus frigoritolerans TaxID=450367 RepID=UPI002B248E69|nr:hypothetical protein [Peribacillus frigoritolerans]MEB2629651.1 hypothetical protein [Peribacillus frigoritolerans]